MGRFTIITILCVVGITVTISILWRGNAKFRNELSMYAKTVNMYAKTVSMLQTAVLPAIEDLKKNVSHHITEKPTPNLTQFQNMSNTLQNNVINYIKELKESLKILSSKVISKFIPEGKRICNVYNNSQAISDKSECVKLGSLVPQIVICIHDPAKDKSFSAPLKAGKIYEEDYVNKVRDILQRYPDFGFIDLGCNVGEYSLIAAHTGRRILAVDARLQHIQMLHHAIVLNNYTSMTTLVHNAISDSRGNVSIATDPTNQGGTHVVNLTASNSLPNVVQSESVLMSDLAPLVTFKNAFMKVDIGGFEVKAFKHADKLFDNVFIGFVQIDWSTMLGNGTGVQPMVGWFEKRGYIATSMKCEPLSNDFKMWPSNVLFKHASMKC